MRLIAGSLIAAALAATATLAIAQPPTPAPAPQPTVAEQQAAAAAALKEDPIKTTAKYAYILDGDTGQALYSKQGDERIVPASMSKLMLYYLVFERLKAGSLTLDTEFTVSEHAWRTGGASTEGSTMFLKLGSKVRVEDLLKGAIIVSGNDACITLAEGIARTEEGYARMATARAAELGLKSSTFANASGLDDPNERMSAHDIATIAYKIIHEFPEYYAFFKEQQFTWNGITQPNRNPLLKEVPGADGVKTGHLEVSGFGLVGSAVRDGKRRIIVLQGLASDKDRRSEGPIIMQAAFNEFKSVKLVDKGAQVFMADVWGGEEKQVPLVVAEDVGATLHVDATKSVKGEVVFKSPLLAPIKAGQEVGELVITADGMPERRVKISAGKAVNERGLIAKAMAGLKGE